MVMFIAGIILFVHIPNMHDLEMNKRYQKWSWEERKAKKMKKKIRKDEWAGEQKIGCCLCSEVLYNNFIQIGI